MKKNLNVIQIKGIRGLIMAGFIVACLFAGFVIFPGLVAMKLWNIGAAYAIQIPSIGMFQGVLLWCIIAAAYYTFRKDKLVVCMKTPDGLSEEELKAVFNDVRKQAQNDKIIQAMLKAREAELKIKTSDELSKADLVRLTEQPAPKELNEQADELNIHNS